jgi:hypothetical protein
MQRLEAFDVLGHTDTNDGSGPMTVVARFRNRDTALEYIRTREYIDKWSVQGQPVCSIYEDSLVVQYDLIIYDSVEELVQHNKEELRQRALLKLTTQERNALGF